MVASRSLTSLSPATTAHKAPDTQSGRRHGPRAELRRCFVKIFLVVQIFSANHTLLSRGSELLPESRRSLERLPRCRRGGSSPPLTLTYCNTHKERDEERFYRGQSLCLYNGLNLEQSTQPGAPTRHHQRTVGGQAAVGLLASPAVFPFVTSPRLCPVRCPLELQTKVHTKVLNHGEDPD